MVVPLRQLLSVFRLAFPRPPDLFSNSFDLIMTHDLEAPHRFQLTAPARNSYRLAMPPWSILNPPFGVALILSCACVSSAAAANRCVPAQPVSIRSSILWRREGRYGIRLGPPVDYAALLRSFGLAWRAVVLANLGGGGLACAGA